MSDTEDRTDAVMRKLRSLTLRRLDGSTPGPPQTFTVSRITVGSSRTCHLIVPHRSMSPLHFELRIRSTRVELRDLDSTHGIRLAGRRVYHVELSSGDRFHAGDIEFELVEAGEVEVPVSSEDRFEQLWGNSPVMREIFAQLDALAQATINVLVAGETGTGKEVAAYSLHLRSGRPGRFIVVDCGGVSMGGLDSAFIDAQGGTLVLDDLAELPVQQQPRLLRLLDRGEAREGSSRTGEPLGVRIVAATRADLPKRVATQRFREDLYFRIAQAMVELPPLRERGRDIELLAEHFLREHVLPKDAPPMELTDDARVAMRDHRWPGNVRELRNVIQRAIHLARGTTIHRSDLALRDDDDLMGIEELLSLPYDEAHTQLDRYYLRRIMAQTRGNITHAAQRLGTSRRALRERLKRLNLYSQD